MEVVSFITSVGGFILTLGGLFFGGLFAFWGLFKQVKTHTNLHEEHFKTQKEQIEENKRIERRVDKFERSSIRIDEKMANHEKQSDEIIKIVGELNKSLNQIHLHLARFKTKEF